MILNFLVKLVLGQVSANILHISGVNLIGCSSVFDLFGLYALSADCLHPVFVCEGWLLREGPSEGRCSCPCCCCI